MKLLLICNNIPIKSDTISVSSKLNSARKSITRTKVKKSRRKSTEMDQVDSHYLSFATLNQGNLKMKHINLSKAAKGISINHITKLPELVQISKK